MDGTGMEKASYQDTGTYLPRLPRIFPGAPLRINGAPDNIQGNLTGRLATSLEHLELNKITTILHIFDTFFLKKQITFLLK